MVHHHSVIKLNIRHNIYYIIYYIYCYTFDCYNAYFKLIIQYNLIILNLNTTVYNNSNNNRVSLTYTITTLAYTLYLTHLSDTLQPGSAPFANRSLRQTIRRAITTKHSGKRKHSVLQK